MTQEELQKGGGGGGVIHGSRELKLKFYTSRELNQTFQESHKIQRSILFIVHTVLQNWGVNYYCFHTLQY